jgi:DNA-binding CsgD family transcriptional regulator/DNA-binding Lrp family transcriptional regulator
MFPEGISTIERDRVSPVFVGRQEQLALALRRWGEAANGTGHFLFVAGEAGIGKTRLLREIGANITDARRLAVGAFPQDFEAVGGLLLGLSSELARAGDITTSEIVRSRLLSDETDVGDRSRNRRLVVGDLASTISNLLTERPTLLLIENLHWADELSLDVIDRLAGTLRDSSSLVIATYRSDELFPRSPLRRLRSGLLARRAAEEIRLPRLDAAQTVTMVESILGEVQASVSIATLYERSDGIPLHIEELLAGASPDSVPETIAEAVLVQTSTLRQKTKAVVEAASVIGRSFDVDLLVAIAGTELAQVDEALRELAERNMVLPGEDAVSFDFRHALIRDAVYASVQPLRKRALHALVAEAARAAGFRDSFISDHSERALLPAQAHAHAMLAAREASRVSAHREAVQLFRRAQRTAPSGIDPAERAALHRDLAIELAAVDENEAAAAQLTAAIDLYRRIGDESSAAAVIPRLAAVQHLLGADYDTRAALIDDALARMDKLQPPASVTVRAGLLAALSTAYMLDRCLDDALETGKEAAALADIDGALVERIDIDTTVGSVLVFAGRPDEGWSLLEAAIARAKDARFEAQAARGYRMMGSCSSVLVEYERAKAWIAEGLDYTANTECWNDHHYLAAHHAHILWATGDWDGAGPVAARALEDGRGGITTKSTALIVLGYLALGRGENESARKTFNDARRIGEDMNELQRLLPALWGLAELDLLEGQPERSISLCELAYEMAEPIGDAAYIFPFLTTGVRAQLAIHDRTGARAWSDRVSYLVQYRKIPGMQYSIAHAEGLLQLADGQTGDARALLEQALKGWEDRGRFWEGTRVLIDLAKCAVRSRRPRDAALLADKALEQARKAGASSLASLAREVGVDHAEVDTYPLSRRELEVARLVSSGATNRDIGERLTISPKTASAHIEHILAKLGASRRSEIATWVSRVELK